MSSATDDVLRNNNPGDMKTLHDLKYSHYNRFFLDNIHAFAGADVATTPSFLALRFDKKPFDEIMKKCENVGQPIHKQLLMDYFIVLFVDKPGQAFIGCINVKDGMSVEACVSAIKTTINERKDCALQSVLFRDNSFGKAPGRVEEVNSDDL